MKRFLKMALFIFAPTLCFGQGTLTITFDGPPNQPVGSQILVQQYFESGMSFRPLSGTDGFARVWTMRTAKQWDTILTSRYGRFAVIQS